MGNASGYVYVHVCTYTYIVLLNSNIKVNLHINFCSLAIPKLFTNLCMYLAPTNVRATVLTPDSVEVTWDQSSSATGYAISYAATAIEDKRVTVTRDCSMSQILTDLKDDTEYTISVQGTTNDGNKDLESDKTYTSVKTSKHGE